MSVEKLTPRQKGKRLKKRGREFKHLQDFSTFPPSEPVQSQLPLQDQEHKKFLEEKGRSAKARTTTEITQVTNIANESNVLLDDLNTGQIKAKNFQQKASLKQKPHQTKEKNHDKLIHNPFYLYGHPRNNSKILYSDEIQDMFLKIKGIYNRHTDIGIRGDGYH